MSDGGTMKTLLVAALAALILVAPARAADPVIAAAGDISCDSSTATSSTCRQHATSDLLVNRSLSKVLTLGDLQYPSGSLWTFQRYYDPSWGRVKSITAPAPGNHEYYRTGAAGYYDYWNGVGVWDGRAGRRDKGYYSFFVADWKIIALNSNCAFVACGPGSPQDNWLHGQLTTNTRRCTLVYMHHPRFSSGKHGNNTAVSELVREASSHRADVILASHDHSYERFAPQGPNGNASSVGPTHFVVGTGGKSHYGFTSVKPNSVKRITGTFGVLYLTLKPSSFDFRFQPEAGRSATDSGSRTCV